jgi:uncharacterized membrane protein
MLLENKKDGNMNWLEKAMRSLGKVVTWRILVTITNFIGGWLASGSWTVGLGVVGFALVVNSILYYFHERTWNRIQWGKTAETQEG